MGEIYKKILVRAPNWIGDAVMATPSLAALRQSCREAEIVLLAKPVIAALFEQHPDIDRVICYEDPGAHTGLSGLWRLSRLLKKERFDLAFLLQNALEAALIASLAGIPERIGYATDGRALLLTQSMKKQDAPPHRTDAYLALVSLLSPAWLPQDTIDPKSAPKLVVTSNEGAAARDFLSSFGHSDTDLFVGINAGAAYGTAKRWLPERFAAVADRLSNKFQLKVLIFGGKSEIDVAVEIKNTMQQPATILTGKTSLRQMMALIAQCRLLITNDSGPMHVASALGVPQIAIFGPTIPTATFSRGTDDVLLHEKADCAPCRHRTCPTDHRCMKAISVDAVFEVAENVMKSSKKRVGAVFLDRDGTINPDPGYIDTCDKFSLFPGAGAAIARLNRRGIPVFLVTNQSGVARSYFPESFVGKLHLYLQRRLAREGAYLDGIYYCPHHPDFMSCACRKPAAGLIQQALLDHSVDFSKSFVVGDKVSDIRLAEALAPDEKATSVLVQTGEGLDALSQLNDSGQSPDHVSKDLTEAVDWILKQHKP